MPSFVVAADHPSLPGHFPGRPIVPGVVLLDEVMALLEQPGRRVVGLPAVRFLRPVRPGERVELTFDEARFSGSVEGVAVIQGSFVVGEAG